MESDFLIQIWYWITGLIYRPVINELGDRPLLGDVETLMDFEQEALNRYSAISTAKYEPGKENHGKLNSSEPSRK